MRVIRGLAALVALMVVLVAVPAFLVIFVGNPLPSDLDWDRLVGGLTRPDDGSILVGLVAIVAWIAWAVFAVSVIVEIVAVVSRQRVRIRLPGLVAPQRLASGLVVAVVALVVVTPQLSHASPARSTPAADHGQGASRPLTGRRPLRRRWRDPDTTADVERAPAALPPTDGTRYTVERGDDLWSLAERFYGEGREWRKIAAANPDVLTGGPDRLAPGWRLLIPDVDQAPAGRTVVVEQGDTLSSIADRLWSDADRWPEVYEANRFQLDDPDDLPVGLTLVLPEAPAATAKPKKVAQPEADSTSRAEPGAGTDAAGVPTIPDRPRASPDALPRPRNQGPATEPPATPGSVTTPPPAPDARFGRRPDGRCPTRWQQSTRWSQDWPGSAVCWRRRWSQEWASVVARSCRSDQWVDASSSHRPPPSWPRRTSVVASSRWACAPSTWRPGRSPPTATAPVQSCLRCSPRACTVTASTWSWPHRASRRPPGSTSKAPGGGLLEGDVDRLRSTPGLRDALRPYPALVTLGVTADGGQVVADLEQLRLTSIEAEDGEHADAVLAAIARRAVLLALGRGARGGRDRHLREVARRDGTAQRDSRRRPGTGAGSAQSACRDAADSAGREVSRRSPHRSRSGRSLGADDRAGQCPSVGR